MMSALEAVVILAGVEFEDLGLDAGWPADDPPDPTEVYLPFPDGDLRDPQNTWLRSDAGHPLGVGMPSGAPLRLDGESHRQAWMRIVRRDPCAYCSRAGSGGTLDHVEPQARPTRGRGGAHCWTNYAGAHASCNSSKGDESLLMFMLSRAGAARKR